MIRLLQLTTYGIKSLEKPITINFANATIEKGLKKLNKVKGIYGYNGGGKSALISSVYFYKVIVTNANCFSNEGFKRLLAKLINCRSNEFYFSAVFASDNGERIFKHEIMVKKNPDQGPFIDEENLSISSRRTLNEDFDLIVGRKGIGPLEGMVPQKELPKHLFGEYLLHRSLVAEVVSMLEAEKREPKNAFEEVAMAFYRFASSILVYLSKTDRRSSLRTEEMVKSMKAYYDHEREKPDEQDYDEENDSEDIVIASEKLEKFKKENGRLEKFIRIFKPSLKSIKLRQRSVGRYYIIKRIFAYDDYEVGLEYESSGIKRLVHLFQYLDFCAKGGIVFIDEIDPNINSVFLGKMISFFKKYGKGQLTFTSHNLETMDLLKNERRAIEVLGDEGEMDHWIQKGNRSPKNDYSSGHFPNSPMNEEDFDFISVFQGED